MIVENESQVVAKKSIVKQFYCYASAKLSSIASSVVSKATRVRELGDKVLLYAATKDEAASISNQLRDLGIESTVEETSCMKIMDSTEKLDSVDTK